MYWFRELNPLALASFFLLCLMWATGGWLLAGHVFRLRPSERLLSGLAAGFLLFITLSNLLANLLPVPAAFWLASGVCLGAGLLAAARSRLRPRIPWSDLRHWQPVAAMLLLAVFLTLLQRGLALFDEYLHMPLISAMAAGDIPPHFYLDPGVKFAYHYGLQVFSASLVQQAGFFPWSAFDLSKALSISLTAVLGWLWLRRVTRNRWAAAAGGFALIVAGGSRWLLLLLPPTWLVRIGEQVVPINTGANTGETLLAALTSAWNIEGGGPMPFPFAFHSGMFAPLIFSLSATSAMWFMTVILFLLLGRFPRQPILAGATLGLLFASLALSAEHIYAILWACMAAILLVQFWRARQRKIPAAHQRLRLWAGVLGISAVLGVLQGGFVTETLRDLFSSLTGTTASVANAYGFSLRWPPGVPTGHLSDLMLFEPEGLLVMLLEFGPALLLAPLATVYAWKRMRGGDWMAGALGLAAIASLVFTLFVRYGVDRSSTRLPATALWLWLLLGFPPLWFIFRRARPAVQGGIIFGYAIAIFGGLIILSVQLLSVPLPQTTYFLTPLDAQMSQDYWNKLPPGAQVLDRSAARGVTVSGRPTRAYADIYTPYPDWEKLASDPHPQKVADAGYDFIYFDREWWQELYPALRAAYNAPGVRLVGERSEAGDFRRLYDLRGLRQAPAATP
jgi:hypothetical protein